MPGDEIRVGLIGAGGNVRDRHIPGFQKVERLEIAAVANRTLESGQSVADQFNIPDVYGGWQELLEDDSIDAVCIGTWPYMHRTLTLAALEKGKHVLTEARMASTAQDARDMLDASLEHPELVCQLTPTSTTYKIDNLLKTLITEGYLGEVLSVEVQALQNRFADFTGDLHWRHDWKMSGYNTLNIGASYESMMRWLGRGNRVMAMSRVHVPYRTNEAGELVSVSIPDHVNILYELANGAQVHMRMSATTGLSTGNQIWIYGTEGTIHVDQQQNVFAGRKGDSRLTEVPNPTEQQAYYRVEEQFTNAIRGTEQVNMVSFETGVHYMEWTEAVIRSAQTGQAIYLPL
ncbi:MAG: Gfo/Idh/MocA family oxidoreductase [Chloroflexota bacterium]|nr:Gfo/Idh/MocA family oxidoreductase [Chloroflexota bacterium]